MPEAYLDQARWLSILVTDMQDVGITGLAYTDVAVYYQKSDGTVTELALTAQTWREAGRGLYDAYFPAGAFDTLGGFAWWCVAAGATDYRATVDVMVPVAGAGSVQRTIALLCGGNPVIGAEVWLTTDPAGGNVVAGTETTNDAGQVTFLVDVGLTYYVWCKSADARFSNPTPWQVT